MNLPKLQRNCLPGYRGAAGLLALTAATVAISGYHVGVEDQAIYLPGILRTLNPALFPNDAALFETQTKHTLITQIVADFTRLTHLSVEWGLLFFHLLAIFLLLLAVWRVADRCFAKTYAVWAGLAMLTGLMLIPIAGTAQFIVDQYMHPRALATALILLPLADFLPGENRRRGWFVYLFTGICFVVAFALQMQMAAFGLGLLVFLAIPWERWIKVLKVHPAALLLIPLPSFVRQFFEPGSPAWMEAARTRSQHYLLRWEWYEWLGIIAPMFLFWWWAHLAEKRGENVLAWFCRRLALYGTLVLVLGGALVIPPAFERLTPFQPMRMFTFIYIYMLVVGGGLLGEFFLRRTAWRWLVVFVPIAIGMYFGNWAQFPASPHIEWPGQTPKNDWVQAFLWIRNNTPTDAYFVLNPHYCRDKGEDTRGFRAWALRSSLADWEKDGAVASLVPAIAPRWQTEVHARDNWRQFQSSDFARLKQEFGVNWAVIEKPSTGGRAGPPPEILDCPYQNSSLYVCKIR
ncbi:MAG: glycosyltransferase family 39 protein [Terriglobia bacterium]|nr:glycosyltransferase family 39 protein [Terriglobia bacterium]